MIIACPLLPLPPSPQSPVPYPSFSIFFSTFWQCKIDFVHHVPIIVQKRSKINQVQDSFKCYMGLSYSKVYNCKNKESEFKFRLYQNDTIDSKKKKKDFS